MKAQMRLAYLKVCVSPKDWQKARRVNENKSRNPAVPALQLRSTKGELIPRAFGRDISNFNLNDGTRSVNSLCPNIKQKTALKCDVPSAKTSSSVLKTYNSTVESVEERLQKFYRAAKEEAERGLNEADREGLSSVYQCAEYAEGVFNYLKERETNVSVKEAFLKGQPEINDRVRAGIIDWMIDVHHKFKMQEETLFLCVSIFDRFLERERVSKHKLGLAGVAAMLIAAKYEEIYPPHLREFLVNVERGVDEDDIMEMELAILQALKFDISAPTALHFLGRYARLLKADETAYLLALYMAESQLLESRMVIYTPSMIAAGALYLARKVLKHDCAFNELLAKQSQYSEVEVQQCAKEIMLAMRQKEKNTLSAAKRKYLSIKYKEVAKISLDLSFDSQMSMPQLKY